MIIKGKVEVEICADGRYCGICPFLRLRKSSPNCDLFLVQLTQLRTGNIRRYKDCIKSFGQEGEAKQ